jgi:hypothetical protein
MSTFENSIRQTVIKYKLIENTQLNLPMLPIGFTDLAHNSWNFLEALLLFSPGNYGWQNDLPRDCGLLACHAVHCHQGQKKVADNVIHGRRHRLNIHHSGNLNLINLSYVAVNLAYTDDREMTALSKRICCHFHNQFQGGTYPWSLEDKTSK